MIDLYRINLNLLVALDTLLTEKSVTEAAKKLFITQSAMSNNLLQLRNIFKDELLIRENKKMILTSGAKLLQPKLHAVLHELSSIISNGQSFNPETSKRIFNIAMSDYLSATLLPKILPILQKKAPHIQIVIRSVVSVDNNIALEEGLFDLGVGKIANEKTSLCKKHLFDDHIVCVLNTKNPLAKKKKITIEDYLSQKHISVCTPNNVPSITDDALNLLGKKREVRLTTPFSIPIFKVIESSKTDLIATMTNIIAEQYQENYHYTVKALPFKTKKIEFYMVWHTSVENDPGHQWLRDLIVSVMQT